MELAGRTNFGLQITFLASSSAYSGTGTSDVGNALLFQANLHEKGHFSDGAAFPSRLWMLRLDLGLEE